MNRTFALARFQRPSVLFIDELDAIGSRIGSDRHGSNYRAQVITGFLQCIDSLADCEGVLLLGACNFPELIDPAVIRAGRFDLMIEMPLPDALTIHSILTQHLKHLDTAMLQDLARRSVGQSAAAIDGAIRAAKGEARARGREVHVADLVSTLGLAAMDTGQLWVSAVHEAGHALIARALNRGRVETVRLTANGGEVVRRQASVPSTLEAISCELAVQLAGRAAETLIFGTPTGGSGGPEASDLAIATNLASMIDTRLGLGREGLIWMGGTNEDHLRDPATRARVRARLEAAEQRALTILTHNQDRLLAFARLLVEERELSGPGLQDLLSDLPVIAQDRRPQHPAI